MAKYKIEFDREACIGAAACVVSAPDFWKIVDDGKASILKGAKYNEGTKKWELTVDEKDYIPNSEAERGCPVLAIKITKIED
jgi:ferredoxin